MAMSDGLRLSPSPINREAIARAMRPMSQNNRMGFDERLDAMIREGNFNGMQLTGNVRQGAPDWRSDLQEKVSEQLELGRAGRGRLNKVMNVGEVVSGVGGVAAGMADTAQASSPMERNLMGALTALSIIPGMGVVTKSVKPALKNALYRSRLTPALERAKKMGYNIDAYHGTRSPVTADQPLGFNEFQTGTLYDDSAGVIQRSSGNPDAYIGPHFAKEPATANKFAGDDTGTWMEGRPGGDQARVMPMKLDETNVKKFKNEDQMNKAIEEQDLSNSDIVNEFAEEYGEDFADNADEFWDKYQNNKAFRRDVNLNVIEREKFDNQSGKVDQVTDAAELFGTRFRDQLHKDGVTTVQYKNKHEGGTSYIAISPSRSRFAKFNKKDKKSRNIMAGVGGAGVAATSLLNSNNENVY